jgi:YbgC/YbaW family acyl-CoA thioester hydrolase
MHKFKKTINFYDCDPAGIIFFSTIFEICHSAYEDLIRTFKLKTDYWNSKNYAVPIIHTEGEYLLPLKPGNIVTVEVSVSRLKESSFELKYICKNEDDKVTNEVKTVHIFVDKKQWKKTPIDPEVKNNLSKHLSDNLPG